MKYLVISDIHLGHRRNKIEDIIKNLEIFFKDNEELFKNLNMIFLAGDVYDRLLSHPSNESILSLHWLYDLALFCKKNKIKLRILEGTPSHDWKQIKVFEKSIKKLITNLDFKYIESLSIEYIKDFNIYILYVPDEWKEDTKDTVKDIKNLLIENNINKVDIAIMHGQFDYQLPIKLEKVSFKEQDILNLVNGWINIGHIHTMSAFNRIIAQGSFDRLAHGEEEPKGAMLMEYYKDIIENKYMFLENKNAKIFKTIKIKKFTKNVFLKLDKELNKLPNDSYVRLEINYNENLLKDIDTILKRYPFLNISKKIIKKEEDNIIDFNKEINMDNFIINKNNIKDVIEKRLKLKKHNKNIIDKCIKHLEQYII